MKKPLVVKSGQIWTTTNRYWPVVVITTDSNRQGLHEAVCITGKMAGATGAFPDEDLSKSCRPLGF